MLTELDRVRQDSPGVQRRWFQDDYFDIFIWQAADGRFSGFQLCYDLPVKERVLSWRESSGFAHHRIDGGESTPFKNMTPIMVADGELPLSDVRTELEKRTGTLEAGLRDFLLLKLQEYGAGVDKATPGR